MKSILLILSFFLNIFCFGQNIKLSGKSYRPFKYKILLTNPFNEKYYNGNGIKDSVALKDGKFSFTIPNQASDIPYAYMFLDKINANSFFQSNIFFVDAKSKNIIIGKEDDPQNFDVDTDNDFIKNEVLRFQNHFAAINDEMNTSLSQLRKEYESFEDKEKIPSDFFGRYENVEKRFSLKEDSLLISYVKTNPDSFVALWKIIGKFERNGYAPVYEEIFNNFSPGLKSKKTAQTLQQAIKQASVLQVGRKFPVSKIKSLDNGTEFSLPKSKYTLVDFWFSHCKPCLEQMPEYVELYSKYHTKGFQMIGIATDQPKYKNNLLETIQKLKIPWTNYWDESGKQSSEWTVNSFPTNYLLDENGNILFKNISEKELSELLNDKLK